MDACPELEQVLLAIRDGAFSPTEPKRYHNIYDALVNWGDHYLLLADYPSYAAAQDAADAAYRDPDAWALKTLHNIAAMGPFSADRTIEQYAREIWKTKPVTV